MSILRARGGMLASSPTPDFLKRIQITVSNNICKQFRSMFVSKFYGYPSLEKVLVAPVFPSPNSIMGYTH
jgi:hypothetical protein